MAWGLGLMPPRSHAATAPLRWHGRSARPIARRDGGSGKWRSVPAALVPLPAGRSVQGWRPDKCRQLRMRRGRAGSGLEERRLKALRWVAENPAGAATALNTAIQQTSLLNRMLADVRTGLAKHQIQGSSAFAPHPGYGSLLERGPAIEEGDALHARTSDLAHEVLWAYAR
jgi:hypothetical protein